jgi:hypothetical protein
VGNTTTYLGTQKGAQGWNWLDQGLAVWVGDSGESVGGMSGDREGEAWAR